jgi:hypothetical protein
VICLIIAAVACLGFGYGAWSQNFNSSGPVSTGTYDVVFSSFTAPSPTLGATFSVYQVDSHTCDISLNNLYPTCNPTFNFVLQDTGSVPAKITDIKINGTSIISGGSVTPTNIALGSDSNNDITVTVSGISTSTSGSNWQIIANNGTLSGSLTVHTWAIIYPDANANDATANAGGSFTFEIDTAQNP